MRYLFLIFCFPLFAQTDYISVSVMRGDRTVLYWTVTIDYSSNFDVEFVVKATSDPSANRLIQKLNSDAGGDSAQVYVTSDTIQITINTANTLNWAARNYYYDILIEANGGGETDTTTIFQGVFTVLQDISSPTDGTIPGSIPVYIVALDTSGHTFGVLAGYDSDNSVSWLSKRAFQDSIGIGWYTPEMYGAVGDGVTDDTQAIQDVIQAGIDSSKMVLFSKQYKYVSSTQFQVDSVAYLGWEFINNSIIDASTSTIGNSIFSFLGLANAAQDLASDIVRGDFIIVVTDGSAFSNGDLVRITTDDVLGGSEEFFNGTDVVKNEMGVIEYVTNDTLVMTMEVNDDYTSGSTQTRIMKISPIRGSINGMRLKGNRIIEFQIGMFIQYTKDFSFVDCNIIGTSRRGVAFSDPYNLRVDHYGVTDFRYTYTSANYGLSLTRYQHVSVTNSNLHGGRHAFVALSTSRFLFFSRNTVSSQGQISRQGQDAAGFDLHEQITHSIITNNVFKTGVGIRSGDFIFENNHIYRKADTLVTFGISAAPNGSEGLFKFDYITIRNNTIKLIGTTTKTNGVVITASVNGEIKGKSIIIENNQIEATTGVSVNFGAADFVELEKLRINENVIFSIGTYIDNAAYGILINDTDEGYIINTEINDNDITGSQRHTISVSSDGDNLEIKGNKMRMLRNAEALEMLGAIKDVSYINNRMHASNLGGTTVTLVASRLIRNIGNSFISTGNHAWAGSRYKDVLTAPLIEERENTYGFDPQRTLTGAVYHTLDSESGNLIYSSAVPTAGTYQNLDRVFNTNLSAGGRLGYIITNTSDRNATIGTLNADTAVVNTVSGKKMFIPYSLTDLYEGANITIVGAFGSGGESTTPSSFITNVPRTLASVNVNAPSSRDTLFVDSTETFTIGDQVIIDRGTSNDLRFVQSKTLTYLLLDSALANTYTNEVVENVVSIYDTTAAVSEAAISYSSPGYAITGHGQFGYREYDGDPSGGGEIFSRLIVTADAEWNGFRQDSISLDADTDYTLKFWAYPEDLASTGVIRFSLFDGDIVITNGSAFARDLILNQWNEIVTTVTVSSSPDATLSYLFFGQNGGGLAAATTFYIDDVTLRKSDNTDVITNGNMETDNSWDWTDYGGVTTNERSGVQFHTLDPLFIGERLLDVTNGVWYVATTTVAAGWKATQSP